jgi:hypothetical protein
LRITRDAFIRFTTSTWKIQAQENHGTCENDISKIIVLINLLADTLCRHFGYLHTALKDHFPQIEQYKFPNKSMFNTFSQHTKERRRSGFEDFLKIVIAIDPLPAEMEDFLELEDHMSSAGKDRSPMRPVPFESDSSSASRKRPQMKDDGRSQGSGDSASGSASWSGDKSAQQEYMPTSMSNGAHPTTLHSQSSSQNSAKVELRNILISTFVVTSIVYALCIYIGVVDITHSSNGKLQNHAK